MTPSVCRWAERQEIQIVRTPSQAMLPPWQWLCLAVFGGITDGPAGAMPDIHVVASSRVAVGVAWLVSLTCT